MKKTLLLLCIFCSFYSETIFSNSPNCNRAINDKSSQICYCFEPNEECYRDYYSGIYLGLGAGVQYLAVDFHQSNIIDTVGIALGSYGNTIERTGHLSNCSVMGDLFLGGGYTFKKYIYLGAEFFIKNNLGDDFEGVEIDLMDQGSLETESPVRPKEINYSFDPKLKLKRYFEYGGGIKFGFLPTAKTMIYFMLGIQKSKFKVDFSDFVILSNNNAVQSVDFSFKKWKLGGLLPAVGIETMISDHFSIRGEYSYVYYGTVRGSSHLINPDNTIENTNNIAFKKINDGTFILSLSYHFGCR